MSPHQISDEERIASREDRSARACLMSHCLVPFSSPRGCDRFWRIWNTFIFIRQKKFKENEKPRIQARVRHHRQKEARPVFAAHLAESCPKISALWAESIYSRGAPGCRT